MVRVAPLIASATVHVTGSPRATAEATRSLTVFGPLEKVHVIVSRVVGALLALLPTTKTCVQTSCGIS